MFSVSVDAGFVLALPFHHGLETLPELGGGGPYEWDINTSARNYAKMQGGGYGVFVGHYRVHDTCMCSLYSLTVVNANHMYIAYYDALYAVVCCVQ